MLFGYIMVMLLDQSVASDRFLCSVHAVQWAYCACLKKLVIQMRSFPFLEYYGNSEHFGGEKLSFLLSRLNLLSLDTPCFLH